MPTEVGVRPVRSDPNRRSKSLSMSSVWRFGVGAILFQLLIVLNTGFGLGFGGGSPKSYSQGGF